MAGERDEDVVEARPLQADRQQLLRERAYELGQESVARGDMETDLSVAHRRVEAVAGADLLGRHGGIRRRESDEVAAHGALEGVGTVERDDLAAVDDGDPPAVLRLVEILGGQEDGELFLLA